MTDDELKNLKKAICVFKKEYELLEKQTARHYYVMGKGWEEDFNRISRHVDQVMADIGRRLVVLERKRDAYWHSDLNKLIRKVGDKFRIRTRVKALEDFVEQLKDKK